MSAEVHDHIDEHEHHHKETFITKYIFSIDHKMISKQYLITGIIMGVIGVMMSMLFRMQLAWPEESFKIFNVLLGDMSLVGNRPLPLKEAESLVTNDYVERFLAPAGITGLWQISKKSKPNMTAEERVDLDIVYARKSNFFNDLKIILKTPSALFQNVDN